MSKTKIVKVRKTGSYYAVLIPRDLAELLGAEYLRAYLEDNRLIYEPIAYNGGDLPC